MSKFNPLYIFAIVAGGALGIFGYAVYFGNNVGTFNVSVGDAKVEMTLEDGEVPFLKIIETLFMTEVSKLATQGILEGKYGYYRMDSPRLIEQIRNDSESSAAFRNTLKAMLRNHEGPFAKVDGFNFRDVSKVNTINEMGDLFGNEHIVAKKVRELCDFGEGICKPVGHKIFISAPSGERIKRGFGAVCKTSRNLGQSVQVTSSSGSMIAIELRNHFYPCSVDDDRGQTKENFVQVSEDDWNTLFSNVAGRGILKAVMYKVPAYERNSIPNYTGRYMEVSSAQQ